MHVCVCMYLSQRGEAKDQHLLSTTLPFIQPVTQLHRPVYTACCTSGEMRPFKLYAATEVNSF